MIQSIRALVRPTITISGWLVFLLIAYQLVIKFATVDTANLFVGTFIGAVTTFIGFWFSERIKGKV